LLIDKWEEIVAIAEKQNKPYSYRIKSKGKVEKMS